MQVPKDEIEAKILNQAQKEFETKAYLRTSMRNIAAKAGVSTSNIYNYFKSKDELFRHVVKPVVDSIERYFDGMEFEKEYLNPDRLSFDYHIRMLDRLAVFLDSNRRILKILAFNAHGSSLQDYREYLTKRFTRITLQFMKEAEDLHPGLKSNVSEFFVHNIASFRMNIVLEILMHDIPYDKMLEFLREMMKFMFYGYEGLTEYDFSKMRPKPLHSM